MTPWVKGEVTCSVCGVVFQGVRNKPAEAPRYCKECGRERNRQRSAERRARTKPGSLERKVENDRRRELRRLAKIASGAKVREALDYLVISCPGEDFPAGAQIYGTSFRYTLSAGHFPSGMLVTSRRAVYRINGTRLERINA